MTEALKHDCAVLGIAVGSVLAGIAALALACAWLAWAAIVVVNLYLVVVLVLSCRKADDRDFGESHPWTHWLVPRMTAGFLVLLLLMIANVTGFAALYSGTDVFPVEKDRLTAYYMSLLTLGFTDFGPTHGYGQRVVIVQLSSAVVLLMGALPLFVSRMSNISSLSTSTGASTVEGG